MEIKKIIIILVTVSVLVVTYNLFTEIYADIVYGPEENQDTVEQPSNPSQLVENPKKQIQLEQIIIPIKVHILTDSSGYYTSARNEESAHKLIEQANRIWEPAKISFEIEEIVSTSVTENAIPAALNVQTIELASHQNYDPNRINMFLVQSLNGINGVALTQINSILLSDFTTVNDYRTVAHEFGHIFGLKHVTPSQMLMARGRNGEELGQFELNLARSNAIKYQ